MPAKVTDPQPLAVAALTTALLDPGPKLLVGSGKVAGFFKGSTAAIKAASRLCEERGWLAGTGEWVGKGAAKKQTYRLSPAGVQAILEHGEAPTVLRTLAAALQQQADQYRSMQDRLGVLAGQLQPLAEVVQRQLNKIQPPDVEQILRRLVSTPPPPPVVATPEPHPPDAGWLNLVVNLVAEQTKKDRWQPLTLPRILAEVRKTHPTLTLGQFHDGLRTLRDQRRVRLTPFTRALATLDDPRNAIFLDGEVMYYVESP